MAEVGVEGPYSSIELIEKTFWSLSPYKDQNRDEYHKVFNRVSYEEWFEFSILSNLHETCMIFLEHAKYYKCRPVET